MVIRGGKLVINYSAIQNRPYIDPEIRVELLEHPDYASSETDNERKIQGYTLDDCDPIKGDRVDRVVTWKGNPDLTPLMGRPVYIRFRMRHACLYSFQVVK